MKLVNPNPKSHPSNLGALQLVRVGFFLALVLLASCGPQRTPGLAQNQDQRANTLDPEKELAAVESRLARYGLEFETRQKSSFGEKVWVSSWVDGSLEQIDMQVKSSRSPSASVLAIQSALREFVALARRAQQEKLAHPDQSDQEELAAKITLAESTVNSLNAFARPANPSTPVVARRPSQPQSASSAKRLDPGDM